MERWFGLTFNETMAALAPRLGARQRAIPIGRIEAIWRIVLSAIAFAAGVAFQFLPDPNVKKLGATVIGLVLGYWLR